MSLINFNTFSTNIWLQIKYQTLKLNETYLEKNITLKSLWENKSLFDSAKTFKYL